MKDSRRYYLHRKVRQLYKLNARSKTIYVPFDTIVSDKYTQELMKSGYSVQLFIPS
ncbi:MAG: hypothetical protein AAF206_26930 [Bacteroidota bacterium]